MSDHSLRPRRRIRDSSGGSGFTVGQSSKDHTQVYVEDYPEKPASRSALSVVFSANPQSLWTSAQDTFSSIPGFSLYGNQQEEKQPVIAEVAFPSTEHLFLFNMPSRDRTSEFRTTAKSYQMKIAVINNPHKATLQHSRLFNQSAQKIGRDLSQTCAKMEKLAEMTKRKSLFENRSEVEHLSRIIKEDMTSLNTQIASLQEYSRSSHNAGQTAGHSQLVVVGLQSKLATVSKDFQSVLEQRSDNLREQKQRQEKFSSRADLPFSLPSSSSQPNVRSRLLDEAEQNGSDAVSVDMRRLENHRSQDQLSLHDDSVTYANARSSTMETIESSISELGQIFSQLAHLVSEQGEMITRIDSNVEETSLNVDSAHSELVKYFHSISQNRWLMIKVFGVLIVFFVVFVLFLT